MKKKAIIIFEMDDSVDIEKCYIRGNVYTEHGKEWYASIVGNLDNAEVKWLPENMNKYDLQELLND